MGILRSFSRLNLKKSRAFCHGIIWDHRPLPKTLVSPINLGRPFATKAPGPPLIYLVGPLAISDLHINICVRLPNTCIALKEFNLLPPNTLV